MIEFQPELFETRPAALLRAATEIVKSYNAINAAGVGRGGFYSGDHCFHEACKYLASVFEEENVKMEDYKRADIESKIAARKKAEQEKVRPQVDATQAALDRIGLAASMSTEGEDGY